jgi:enoyl-CoA hydratase/carnithine racemase
VSVVTTSRAGAVATLTLNRPEKKNALSIEVRDAIVDELDRLATDEAVKVVVVTGAGDVFCAGFDLREFTVDEPGFQERLWQSSDVFHHRVLRFPLPLVASINGAALAGGLDLAVMCDLRIASATATFGHPEQTFGDVVYGPLHDLVGGAAARDLCFTGRRIDAEEALRIGLVSRVVPAADLASATAEVTSAIVRAPREFLVRTKAKAVARAAIDEGTRTLDL